MGPMAPGMQNFRLGVYPVAVQHELSTSKVYSPYAPDSRLGTPINSQLVLL